jgi:hypothetical protein
MCINRKWDSISFIRNAGRITIFGIREPAFMVKIPIEIHSIHATVKIEDLEEGFKLLESYKNCECPTNPNCHKDGNIILAKQ